MLKEARGRKIHMIGMTCVAKGPLPRGLIHGAPMHMAAMHKAAMSRCALLEYV